MSDQTMEMLATVLAKQTELLAALQPKEKSAGSAGTRQKRRLPRLRGPRR